jgi:DnaJ-class molecular chaperone
MTITTMMYYKLRESEKRRRELALAVDWWDQQEKCSHCRGSGACIACPDGKCTSCHGSGLAMELVN